VRRAREGITETSLARFCRRISGAGHYPAGGRTGDNCLLATKAMILVNGPVREDAWTARLTPIEIPRSVDRDHRFDHLGTGPGLVFKSDRITLGNGCTIGTSAFVHYGVVIATARASTPTPSS